MSDPKEALERLKAYVAEPRITATARQHAADLRTLIAEREGLEREVERVEGELERIRRVDAEALRPLAARSEAAEAKLSALEEAAGWFAAHRKGISADVSSAHSGRGNGASQWMREDDNEFRSELRAAFDKLDALLQPTVENNT